MRCPAPIRPGLFEREGKPQTLTLDSKVFYIAFVKCKQAIWWAQGGGGGGGGAHGRIFVSCPNEQKEGSSLFAVWEITEMNIYSCPPGV